MFCLKKISDCNNEEIFKAINNVSKDITNTRLQIREKLLRGDKDIEMYKWYLEETNQGSTIPVCGTIPKKSLKKANKSVDKMIKQSLKPVKEAKPKTKIAKKNRDMINSSINDTTASNSDSQLRAEWISLVSGNSMKDFNKKNSEALGFNCPVSKSGGTYSTLIECSENNKITKDKIELLKPLTDNDIDKNYCIRILNTCKPILQQTQERVTNSSYSLTIPQLREAVKNLKKKQ